jgi:hypothetical protein
MRLKHSLTQFGRLTETDWYKLYNRAHSAIKRGAPAGQEASEHAKAAVRDGRVRQRAYLLLAQDVRRSLVTAGVHQRQLDKNAAVRTASLL